ncbi:hypothetical protein [Micavibrio aeruginosavorus]|uniref:hypothetical protein n=1 Tax=Micavibrio aeruginosavorus TaxID=349221 RepID=UPI003F4AB98D
MLSNKKLYDAVVHLRSLGFSDFIDPDQNIEGMVDAIIFEWAGVADMDPGARGPNIDARRLAVLELLTGKAFVQTGAGGEVNPLFWGAESLNQGYHIMFSSYFAFMLSQSAARDLFTGTVLYDDIGDGGVRGITGLDQDALSRLTRAVKSLPDKKKNLIWLRALMVIDDAVAINNLSRDDQALLYDAVLQTGADWDHLMEELNSPHPRDIAGSFYAENVLGLRVDDCDLLPLFTEARKRDQSRQIVMNSLMTHFVEKCAPDEKSALALFRNNGFMLRDVTSIYNQREVFGKRRPYDKIVYASKIPAKEKIRGYAMLPYDGYNVNLFIRDGKVDWASAHIQRPNKN